VFARGRLAAVGLGGCSGRFVRGGWSIRSRSDQKGISKDGIVGKRIQRDEHPQSMNDSVFDVSDRDDRTKSYTDVKELVEGNDLSIWVRSENLIRIFVCKMWGACREEMAGSAHISVLRRPTAPWSRLDFDQKMRVSVLTVGHDFGTFTPSSFARIALVLMTEFAWTLPVAAA
jgi:hypothetical protein